MYHDHDGLHKLHVGTKANNLTNVIHGYKFMDRRGGQTDREGDRQRGQRMKDSEKHRKRNRQRHRETETERAKDRQTEARR